MIKEEENEKDYKFFKIILLLVQSFVIGVCVIFFIGVSKVNALQQRVNLDTNGFHNDWATTYLEENVSYQDNTYLLDNRTWLQYKDFAMSGTNKYNLDFKLKVIYNKTRNSQVISNLYLTLYNGTTLVNMGNSCTKTVTKQSIIIQTAYLYEVHCVGINGNGYYPYINVQVYSDEIQQKITQVSMLEWSFYVSQTSSDTDSINSNNNKNTESIINNNNTNTESIMNNQNENTEKEIESQQVCTSININQLNGMGKNNYALGETNNEVYDAGYAISDYIEIGKGNYQILRATGNANSYCLYDMDKTLKSCTRYNLGTSIATINITSNETQYIRFTIRKNQDTTLTGRGCKNGNQANNEALNDINNSLNDETLPNIGNIQVTTIDDTPISSLLLLPLSLINVILDATDGACVDYNIGSLFGHQLKFKCIDFNSILGSSLYHTIDLFFAFFMIYEIFKMFITAFNDITSLRDGFDSLYEPRHAEYKPKHGAGYERIGD